MRIDCFRDCQTQRLPTTVSAAVSVVQLPSQTPSLRHQRNSPPDASRIALSSIQQRRCLTGPSRSKLLSDRCTTSLEVVRVLSLQLFSQLLVVVVVLRNRPLLASLASLAALLGRLRGLRGALALSAVIGLAVFSSSLSSLLAAVEGASHLLELCDAMGDGLGGAIYQKGLVEARQRGGEEGVFVPGPMMAASSLSCAPLTLISQTLKRPARSLASFSGLQTIGMLMIEW
jgi:hypothetical protein